MAKMNVAFFVTFCCLAAGGGACAADEVHDVVVYGGTSGGVIAAVQAGRMGKNVVLLEPTHHIGGMTAGGLGATDMGNEKAIAGVSREFYQRILQHYQQSPAWKYETRDQYEKREKYYRGDALFGFEPHVAEQTYKEMAADAHVQIELGERLELKEGVKTEGRRIVSIRMESGRTFAGKVFIDATYEGDLMARAGVTYTVGREANSRYGETINGIVTKYARSHQFTKPVDPFVKPGDSASGLLAYIHLEPPGEDGQADKHVQAYNYRICMTDASENRVPFPQPSGYDDKDYELLLRAFEAGAITGIPWGNRGMPNRKTDTNNNGPFSTDFIGMADDYPDADFAARDKITATHVHYMQGLLWTVANNPRVPEHLRAAVNKWGLSKDEFADNGNWPYQLYVREARRMVSDYVVTEQDTTWKRQAEDPVGLGSYNMDSHNCQRYVDASGHARNEGDVQVGVAGPFGISYRAIVPRSGECGNLIVPVCCSASHAGYASIRMEPVYMILGQAAGTAAAIAIDEAVDLQKLPYSDLRLRLLADKQLIEWTGGGHARVQSADLPGIVVDVSHAKLVGDWTQSKSTGGVSNGYKHDADQEKGSKSARYELKVPKDGIYEIRLSYVPNVNRAANVPVTIDSADGSKTVTVNQRETPPIDGLFVSLGKFHVTADQSAAVVVSNTGTNGFVVIDAVQALLADNGKATDIKSANPEYADFYTGQSETSSKGIDWVQAISVSSPAYCSDIKGDVTVNFTAPGLTRAEALCWQQPTSENTSVWGHDAIVASIAIDASGNGSFIFHADQFPNGPIMLRIHAKDEGKKQDLCQLQLFNKGGVVSNQGIPRKQSSRRRRHETGLRRRFQQPTLDHQKRKRRDLSSAQTGGGDFSGWPFTDPSGPLNPFSQVGTWMRFAPRGRPAQRRHGNRLFRSRGWHRSPRRAAVLF